MSKNKTLEQLKEKEDFKKSLEGKSKEELEKIEQEIIQEAEELDKELMSAKVSLQRKNYETVAQHIRDFLDKQTIQWQYAQAMATMYEFWDPNVFNANIEYPMLHQTLTTLGNFQFTGYKEWKAVIEINEYFEPIREEYIKLASKPYEVANRHGIVMDMLGLQNPVQVQEG